MKNLAQGSTVLSITREAQKVKYSPCCQGVYSLLGEMDKYTTKSNIGMAVTNAV